MILGLSHVTSITSMATQGCHSFPELEIEEIWGENSNTLEEIWQNLVQNLRRIEEIFFHFYWAWKHAKNAKQHYSLTSGNYFQTWIVTKYQLTVKEFTITKLKNPLYKLQFIFLSF